MLKNREKHEKKVKASALDAIKTLWQERFFLKSKSQRDLENELHRRGHDFGYTIRKTLSRIDFLEMTGTKGNRRFIQKYPYVEGKPHLNKFM